MLATYRRNEQQTQEDFFKKIFVPLTLFVKLERVVWGFTVRGSSRSNITEIFWPQIYGRQRCVFLVLVSVRQEVSELETDELETRCGRESYQPAEGGLRVPSSFGDPLVTRCVRKSQHSAESWTPRPSVEHQENEEDTTLIAIRVGVNILQFLFSFHFFSHANLTIKWEIYFFKKSSLVCFNCVNMYPACIWIMCLYC